MYPAYAYSKLCKFICSIMQPGFLSFLRYYGWIFLPGAIMLCRHALLGIFFYPFCVGFFLLFGFFRTFWIFSYFWDFSFSGALMICTLGGGQWGIWDNAADNLGPHCWLTGTLSETTNRHPQSRKYTILKELKGRVR